MNSNQENNVDLNTEKINKFTHVWLDSQPNFELNPEELSLQENVHNLINSDRNNNPILEKIPNLIFILILKQIENEKKLLMLSYFLKNKKSSYLYEHYPVLFNIWDNHFKKLDLKIFWLEPHNFRYLCKCVNTRVKKHLPQLYEMETYTADIERFTALNLICYLSYKGLLIIDVHQEILSIMKDVREKNV